MPTVALNAQWVDRVKSPESGQVDYFDSKMPGFGLRASRGGKRSWILLYRVKGDPRKRRLTLGEYPALTLADAREKARAIVVGVDRGADPATAKQTEKGAATFEALALEYLERHAKPNKRTWKDDERALRKDVFPVWGQRKAHEIKRKDVILLLDAIQERGAPIMANRTLALVRKVFNWAISRDLLEANPCAQVKPAAAERQSDRCLTEDEIRLVWSSFSAQPPAFAAMFKLRLLTAQRGGEIESMRWADVDLAARWWTIPAERAKNGLSHRVPLSSPSLALLQEQHGRSGTGEWVFPSRQRTVGPVANSRHAADSAKEKSGVDFVLHDLRRTAASYMCGMSISRLVVSKILNHVETGITRVYDRHGYDTEKRQALDAWAERLIALVAGTPSEVVNGGAGGDAVMAEAEGSR
jgi:integrase